MFVLKELAVGVERVFLTVILNEVLMTSTDFMEEKSIRIAGKEKQQYGGYVKITGSHPRPHLSYSL